MNCPRLTCSKKLQHTQLRKIEPLPSAFVRRKIGAALEIESSKEREFFCEPDGLFFSS